MPIQDFFTAAHLPHRPYCSDDKSASRIRPATQALTYAYIQLNPPGLLRWLVFDIDRPDASLRWDALNQWGVDTGDWSAAIPTPNIVVANPVNGHAHYYYCLDTPVCTSERGRKGPQRYAKAVYAALAVMLGCDTGYTVLIAKNPLHDRHLTYWLRPTAYDLAELAEYLDLDSGRAWRAISKRSGQRTSEKGRNCSLFERLRHWAYAWVEEYRSAGREQWLAACLRQATAQNQFDGHRDGNLSEAEVRAVARSVGRWVWNRYSPCIRGTDEEFIELQAARGRCKGQVKRDELLPEARALAAAGKSQREIATLLGVSQKTVSNWLMRTDKPNATT
ncbi:MAG TPA: replication initiation protein [Rhodocyclaceae bacterium]|nr:replication initiation protein [Rhodocyclaceae bacterium]